MICTRFNPSCNGPLHLGHIYTALVNERYAHSQGGRFVVRFDDSHPARRETMGERVAVVREQQRADLSWLGLDVDLWQNQSDLQPRLGDAFSAHGYTPRPFGPEPPLATFVSHQRQETWLPWPHSPSLTEERVWFDHWAGVTHVIRGEDLATEYSLYCYLCERFGLPSPLHIYLPRLESSKGDISKTAGGYTIAEMRADGYTPSDVCEMLERACLVLPGNGWTLGNLKTQPRLAL